MPTVKFTKNLNAVYPNLQEIKVEARTVAEVVAAIEQVYPRLAAYLVDERGSLRKHVNIFVGAETITDRVRLSDAVRAADEVYIFQALSGGLAERTH
ncbi:MAG: MoaD/ThiS family protein [Candidatus Poribacteria bacterium]|nr:MoaD/ThiS family protein [Candidatus Poribacteria bacterium]